MKKFLSLFLVGFFVFVGFASADSVDGFISDSDICSITLSNTEYISLSEDLNSDCLDYDNYVVNFCVASSNVPYSVYDPNGNFLRVNSNSYCSSLNLSDSSIVFFPYSQEEYSDNDYLPLNGVFYYSKSPITYSSSDDNDSVSGLPGMSDGFANGITSGVSSLTGGISNIVPTLILFMLPLLIVWLFRKYLYSWLKHVFVVDKPNGDDIANCNLTLNKYGQFEHHIKGLYDYGDYVDIPGVGFVGKRVLPYYLDENLEFKDKDYKQDRLDYINSLFRGKHYKEYVDLYKEYGDADYAESKLRGKYYNEYVDLYKNYVY